MQCALLVLRGIRVAPDHSSENTEEKSFRSSGMGWEESFEASAGKTFHCFHCSLVAEHIIQ